MTEIHLKLIEEYKVRTSKNPKYSIRAFARHLGISPGALSSIINGKRSIGIKIAKRIEEKLGLTNLSSPIIQKSKSKRILQNRVRYIKSITNDSDPLAQIVKQIIQSLKSKKSGTIDEILNDVDYEKKHSMYIFFILHRMGIIEIDVKGEKNQTTYTLTTA